MLYAVYTLVFALSLIGLSPYFLYRTLRHKNYLANLRQRLGWSIRIQPSSKPTIWIHAVSVGETLAVQPLVRLLHTHAPGHRLVLSTTTITGQAIARQRLSEWAEVIFFPLDFGFSVRRCLNAVAPSLVLIVETEIWPNFLRACHRRQIPVVLTNGRISDQSFTGYRMLRRLMARVLDHFSLLLIQSQRDADRLLKLGGPADRVIVTGNLKFDLNVPDWSRKLEELDRWLGLTESRLVVAGSTAPGEEMLLLNALARLTQQPELRNVRLLLAPRHPERFDEVARLIGQTGLSFVRRSQAQTAPNRRSCQVILLDTLGELAAVYKAADIVFVGGSLVPVGGHNILEPALFGKPILVGPYTSNFQAIVDEFVEREAIIQLAATNSRSTGDQLTDTLRSLLQESARAEALGQRARRLVEQHRGATDRTLEHIAPFLQHDQTSGRRPQRPSLGNRGMEIEPSTDFQSEG